MNRLILLAIMVLASTLVAADDGSTPSEPTSNALRDLVLSHDRDRSWLTGPVQFEWKEVTVLQSKTGARTTTGTCKTLTDGAQFIIYSFREVAVIPNEQDPNPVRQTAQVKEVIAHDGVDYRRAWSKDDSPVIELAATAPNVPNTDWLDIGHASKRTSFSGTWNSLSRMSGVSNKWAYDRDLIRLTLRRDDGSKADMFFDRRADYQLIYEAWYTAKNVLYHDVTTTYGNIADFTTPVPVSVVRREFDADATPQSTVSFALDLKTSHRLGKEELSPDIFKVSIGSKADVTDSRGGFLIHYKMNDAAMDDTTVHRLTSDFLGGQDSTSLGDRPPLVTPSSKVPAATGVLRWTAGVAVVIIGSVALTLLSVKRRKSH